MPKIRQASGEQGNAKYPTIGVIRNQHVQPANRSNEREKHKWYFHGLMFVGELVRVRVVLLSC